MNNLLALLLVMATTLLSQTHAAGYPGCDNTTSCFGSELVSISTTSFVQLFNYAVIHTACSHTLFVAKKLAEKLFLKCWWHWLKGCLELGNCNAMVIYQFDTTNKVLNVMMQSSSGLNPNSYIAIGISTDNQMGNDLVRSLRLFFENNKFEKSSDDKINFDRLYCKNINT